jgi:HEXXH motif-containing protein
LSDEDLGPGQAARYRRLIDDDSNLQLQIRAFAPGAFPTVSEFVSDGAALLEAAMPELAGEMKALVREIVLVDKPGNRHFGASSFQIWGALFLKPYPHGNRAAIVEQLAHETSHALLFGLSKGQPLVRNDPNEVYPSPIRQDLRPMDGVVHATYVIARMHYAMSQLLGSGLLSAEEAKVALATRDAHRAHYKNGLAVVETNAKWTEVGEAAHSSARAYMAAADDA